jgi:hypothetical protein
MASERQRVGQRPARCERLDGGHRGVPARGASSRRDRTTISRKHTAPGSAWVRSCQTRLRPTSKVGSTERSSHRPSSFSNRRAACVGSQATQFVALAIMAAVLKDAAHAASHLGTGRVARDRGRGRARSVPASSSSGHGARRVRAIATRAQRESSRRRHARAPTRSPDVLALFMRDLMLPRGVLLRHPRSWLFEHRIAWDEPVRA